MEAIKDIDQHLLCMADPIRGILEHIHQKEKIVICLPVGGEAAFSKEKTYTIIRRETSTLFRVHSYHVSS